MPLRRSVEDCDVASPVRLSVTRIEDAVLFRFIFQFLSNFYSLSELENGLIWDPVFVVRFSRDGFSQRSFVGVFLSSFVRWK